LQSLIEGRLNSGVDNSSQKPSGKKGNSDPESDGTDFSNDASKPDGMTTELIAFLQLLYNTLIENDVSEIYVNQIIDEVQKVIKPGVSIDYLIANIYQKMILKFGLPEPIGKTQTKPKLVFFIGPTGVGKTTTIAKISSRFALEQKWNVGLLTADTFRIAAADQLKTYAGILDIPFKVIYSPEDVKSALEEFKECDYILVDTAGYSYQNEQHRESVKSILQNLPDTVEREVYLVVSATTKYRDLLRIADSYALVAPYRLIFTKLDETLSLGNLLNLRLYTGVPLSYVTYGQNVPDDIEQFNPQETVRMLLGGK